jgi:hypothetical protein
MRFTIIRTLGPADYEVFILKHYNEEDNKIEIRSYVGATEAQAFRDLLADLADLAGPISSRHSAERINITVEPGDKYLETAEEFLDLIVPTKPEDFE